MHTPKSDFDGYMSKEISLWEIKVHVEASEDNWQSKKIPEHPVFSSRYINPEM